MIGDHMLNKKLILGAGVAVIGAGAYAVKKLKAYHAGGKLNTEGMMSLDEYFEKYYKDHPELGSEDIQKESFPETGRAVWSDSKLDEADLKWLANSFFEDAPYGVLVRVNDTSYIVSINAKGQRTLVRALY